MLSGAHLKSLHEQEAALENELQVGAVNPAEYRFYMEELYETYGLSYYDTVSDILLDEDFDDYGSDPQYVYGV